MGSNSVEVKFEGEALSLMEEPKKEGFLSLEDSLTQEYGLTITKKSPNFELPPNIDFNALNQLGISEGEAKDMVEAIVNFINLPIIIDKFNQDHTSRREWRKEIENHYGQEALSFLKNNKLRVNSFTFINFFFVRIDLYMRKNIIPENLLGKTNSIREQYSTVVRGYENMDIDEKVLTVKKLEDLFIEVLGLFS